VGAAAGVAEPHAWLTPVLLTPLCLQIAVGVAEEKLQPALPSNLPADLLVIATMCCDFDPGLRPSFDLIADELHKVVQQMQVRTWVD
jgi:hypothetical protein